jgi:uncharacterized membrane protein
LVVFVLTLENGKVGSGRLSRETLAILALIIAVSVAGGLITIVQPTFIFSLLPGGTNYVVGGTIYEVIFTVLTLVINSMYLFGGIVIAYGTILVLIRFFQCKIRDPYKPSLSTRYLSGYLTLGLEIFIGAEIIRTVIVRTPDEFALLILVIVSRGLFSLILYLERRWYGTIETE